MQGPPLLKRFKDAQICRQCKGMCCQAHPGLWVRPMSFFSSFGLETASSPEALKEMLPDGITLRQIDGVSIPAPLRTQSGCYFLGHKGCMLPESQRPEQCLALKPKIETLIEGAVQCELHPLASSINAIMNWQSFWRK